VDWHVRDAVAKTMRELGEQYNAPALVAAYVDGLETVAGQVVRTRVAYVGVLQAAAAAARNLRRD
jgi:hypothetical protein